MATLSVLSYGSLPQTLAMKNGSSSSSTNQAPTLSDSGHLNTVGGQKSISLSKTFSRITMQNVLSENNGNTLNISNNNVNTIVRKIKDFGMFGTVNNVNGDSRLSVATARKRSPSESKLKPDNKLTSSTAKKQKITKDSSGATSATSTPKTAKKTLDLKFKSSSDGQTLATPVKKVGGTPGRKGLPLPQAVARRNARERNRVKQVNNGFAALRERIPEEVAEVFEAQGAGRGGSVKKLSKVETLRMAVEYIRSLEHQLGYDFPVGSDRGLSLAVANGSSSEDSFTLVKDEFDVLSPALDENFDDSMSNYDMDEYLNATQAQYDASEGDAQNLSSYQMDMLPNITTVNGLQYIRIPGTNTYQLLTPDIFVGNSNSPPNSSIDEEPFGNALIDTNCLSPTTSTAATTTADQHSSPPSIIRSATAMASVSAPANAMQTIGGARANSVGVNVDSPTSGECVNVAAVSTLSRSPVPQSTSPNATLPHQHQQQQQQVQPAVILSPADNKVLLQSCATEHLAADERQFVIPTPPQQQQHQHQQRQQILQPHAIKQEFHDTTTNDFVNAANSLTDTLVFRRELYQQQRQAQHMLPLTMSPPLERVERGGAMTMMTPTTLTPSTLPALYDAEQSASFYEGVVTFKKELNDVYLENSVASNMAPVGLADENMIEVIDWWEAHTPKSDGSGAML